jgi:predicted nucleic acid-binding protein
VAIGLDTSVVVRLLVGEPVTQADAARRRLTAAFESGELVLVSDLVAAETYHALHYHYAVPKAEARALLRRFLDAGLVTLDPEASLAVFAPAGGAGLVDRLIHARYRSLGAVTLTFESRQARLEGAEQLRT